MSVDGSAELMLAAEAGLTELVERNLENQSNIEAKDNLGRTAFMRAAAAGQYDTVKLVWEAGSDLHVLSNNGQTAFWLACNMGHVDIITFLLDQGAELETADTERLSPIMAACRNGHGKAVQLLLTRGATYDRHFQDGKTMLATASILGHRDTAEVFLHNGIPVEETDNIGRTVLMHAAAANQVEVIDLLISRGAKIDSKDQNGLTPLMHAVLAGAWESTKKLLESGAAIDQQDDSGRTSLMLAAEEHQDRLRDLISSTMIDLLLEYAPDMRVTNREGKNAIQVAKSAQLQDKLTKWWRLHLLEELKKDPINAEVPKLERSPIVLQPGEVAYFFQEADIYRWRESEIERSQSDSKSTGIGGAIWGTGAIAMGTSRSSSQGVKWSELVQHLQKLDSCKLVITNKRIIFTGPRLNSSASIEQIQARNAG